MTVRLLQKFVQINTLAAAGRRDGRGRGSLYIIAVHHLYDFCRWRWPNGGAKKLRKVADPCLVRRKEGTFYRFKFNLGTKLRRRRGWMKRRGNWNALVRPSSLPGALHFPTPCNARWDWKKEPSAQLSRHFQEEQNFVDCQMPTILRAEKFYKVVFWHFKQRRKRRTSVFVLINFRASEFSV